tara:strand:- start:425 stop:1090 length:666 start_codon:yes stop_codon:yes gene_type:complete
MEKKINYNRFKKSDNPHKAIVAIHGWGGNKNSFSPFVKNIKIDDVEWFLPEAPYLVKDAPPINSDNIDNDGLSRKSWTYKKENGTWEVKEPITMLKTFLNDIVFKQYNPSDVYFIGFSQGAAVCYECVMGIKKELGGIFPIGGFLFKDSEKDKMVSAFNMETPILIGHGIKDDVIPIEKSKIAYNKLLKEGANVKFYDYNGGHKISIKYIKEVVKIINESE